MDASKITELRQKQANRYINRAPTCQDSSTLTYQQQIKSSKYIASYTPENPNHFLTNYCNTCGPNSRIAISNNSTIPQLPSPLTPSPLGRAAGSGTTVYSSDKVMLQRAGITQCCSAPVDIPNVGNFQYITLPRCDCEPNSPENPNLNPYLPIPQPYLQTTGPFKQILYPAGSGGTPISCVTPCVEQNTPTAQALAATKEQVVTAGGAYVTNRNVNVDCKRCIEQQKVPYSPYANTDSSAGLGCTCPL